MKDREPHGRADTLATCLPRQPGGIARAAFATDHGSETVPERLARVAAACGEHEAVVDQDRAIDFATLHRASAALAMRLCEAGPARPRVAILHDDNIASILSIFGAAMAGGVSANLATSSPADYLAHQLTLFRPDIVIADADARARHRYEQAVWLTVRPEAAGVSGDWPIGRFAQVHPDDPVGVNFTSGTTGLPKAVARSHRNALLGVDGFGRSCGIAPGERVVLFDPLSFAGGRAAAFWTLLNGASLRLFPLRTAGATDLVAWLRRTRPSFLKTTPTAFRNILHAVGSDALRAALEGLRILSFEGEPCRTGDVATFRDFAPDGCLLRLTYSATEFGNAAQCFLSRDFLPDARGVPSGFVNPGYHVRQGRPAPGTEGDAGQTDAEGAAVLHVRGAGVVREYVGAPDLTRKHFLPPDAQGHSGFVTNDHGFVDADGLLFVTGRQDAMLKLRGFRLSPAEIEEAICRTLPVVQAAVTVSVLEGGPLKEAPERLVAHVVMADGAVCDRAAFRQRLGRVLPDHAVPQFFLPLDCLPVRPNGKVDRAALPRLTPANVLGASRREAPLPGTETVLAEIWQRTLHVGPVGRHDAFEDLGGDSLAALKVVLEIEAAFKRALPATVLSDHPTIAALAARLDDPDNPPDPLMTPLRPGPGARLIFLPPPQGDGLMLVKFIPQLPPDADVRSLQCRALAQSDPSLPTDPDRLVTIYADRVATLPPRRPLVLMGFSYGGVLAFLLSRALEARGIAVDRVILLDTYGPACRRRAKLSAQQGDTAPAGTQPPQPAGPMQRAPSATQTASGEQRAAPARAAAPGEPAQRLVRFVPGEPVAVVPTPADLALIRGTDTLNIVCAPDYGWSDLTTGAFRLLRLASDHTGMMRQESVPILGEMLRDLLHRKAGCHDNDA